MITILPPELKEQVKYSRYNVIARRYLVVILLIIAAVSASLWFGHRYADEQLAAYENRAETIRTEARDFQDVESEVNAFNTKMAAIDGVLKSRTAFSDVLEEFAEVLPSGAFINGISLADEIDSPLDLTVIAQSRDQALVIRNALLQSELVTDADIQSISNRSNDDGVTVILVIGLDEEAL